MVRKADLHGWARPELSFQRGASSFCCGATRMDLATHAVWVSGRPIGLRPMEERLLALLWTAANRVVLSDVLIFSLYGNISVAAGRARLKRLVADIRHRFGTDVATRLCTVPKVGLVLYAEGVEPQESGAIGRSER